MHNSNINPAYIAVDLLPNSFNVYMKNTIPLFNKNFFIENKIQLPTHKREGKVPGGQIFHYCSEDLDTTKHFSTHQYIKKHFQNASVFENDASTLLHGIQTSVKNDLILEFGVCSGKTINFIAGHNPSCIIYGFDSFEGLPEDWQSCVPKKSCRLLDSNVCPPLLANVCIEKGMFEDTLPTFSNNIGNRLIGFMHVDCDIYSSTKTIFFYLKKNIRSGTMILFDEYFNYDGWENHEYKAFSEFISENDLSYEYVAYNRLHQQVLVKII
jgi:hypothetical protein